MKCVSFAELEQVCKDDGWIKHPEPKKLPTWERLVRLEPKLIDLHRQALLDGINLPRDEYDNNWWKIADAHRELVGWRVNHPVLGTSAAYDVCLDELHYARFGERMYWLLSFAKRHKHTRERGRMSSGKRMDVMNRDGFRCQYCGATAATLPDGETLVVDHIRPVSKGGTSDIQNLVTACGSCNRGKAAKILCPGCQ